VNILKICAGIKKCITCFSSKHSSWQHLRWFQSSTKLNTRNKSTLYRIQLLWLN